MDRRVLKSGMLAGLVCVVVGCFPCSISLADTVSLQFSGHLTTAGSCQQLSDTHIRCQVSAGTQGQLQLQATVSPTTRQVSITAVSVPGWASFSPATAMGTVTASCAFTPPTSAAGTTVDLVFRASVLGMPLHLDLTVTLDVAAGGPVEPSSYGPYSGVTDASGRISVLIPWMDPPAYVVGTLMECPERILAYTAISVTLVPKQTEGIWGLLFGGLVEGGATISSAEDIGSVIVSSSGYEDVTVSDLSYTSSMDLWGSTTTSVHLGDFCLGSSQELTLTGVTDASGRISVLIPWMTGDPYIVGTLLECPQRVLAYTSFSLTLVPTWIGGSIANVEDIGSVIVSVSGYEDVTVGDLSYTSSMDLWGSTTTSVNLGDFCLGYTSGAPGTTLTGTTDTGGGFTLDLPWLGATVSGTLAECTIQPLPDQAFSVTLVPRGDAIASIEDIGGLAFSVDMHEGTTFKDFTGTSLLGATSFDLGDVCFSVDLRKFTCPPPEPGYKLVGFTYTKDFRCEECWGRSSASKDGYVYMESYTVVKNFETERDEIWSCCYEPVDKTYPDLVVESVVVSSGVGVVATPFPIRAGTTANILVLVRNAGEEAAPGCTVEHYLDPLPGVYEEKDIPPLAAGESTTVVFTHLFPSPGTYTATVFVDSNGVVDEWEDIHNNMKEHTFNVVE
jgi:hypothetical protein